MVVKSLKGIHPGNLTLVLLASCAAWLPAFIWQAPESQRFALKLLTDAFATAVDAWPPFTATVLFALALAQGAYVNLLNTRHILIGQRTYLPMVLVTTLSALYTWMPDAVALSAFNLLFFRVIDIVFTYSGRPLPPLRMMQCGITIGVTGFLAWQAMLLLPFIWVIAVINNNLTLRGILSSTIGYITVWLVFGYALVLWGDLPGYIRQITQVFGHTKTLSDIPLQNLISISPFLLAAMVSLASSWMAMDRKKIITRRLFSSLHFVLLISVAITLIFPHITIAFLYLGTLPFAVVFGEYLLKVRKEWVADLFLCLTWAGVAYHWIA